jgi:hypothetical protein
MPLTLRRQLALNAPAPPLSQFPHPPASAETVAKIDMDSDWRLAGLRAGLEVSSPRQSIVLIRAAGRRHQFLDDGRMIVGQEWISIAMEFEVRLDVQPTCRSLRLS